MDYEPILRSLPTAVACDLLPANDYLPNGAVRVATVYGYGDGDLIDVHWEPGKDELSDFSGAVMQLWNYGVAPYETEEGRRRIEAVCSRFGVRYDRGNLSVPLAGPSAVEDAVSRLARACQAVVEEFVEAGGAR